MLHEADGNVRLPEAENAYSAGANRTR
jgi:hypothetical protein